MFIYFISSPQLSCHIPFFCVSSVFGSAQQLEGSHPSQAGMLMGSGKSLEVRQDCAQCRAVLPALHTELEVQPEPLAEEESTAQKSLPKIFHLLGVSGIWQVPLAFIFSFYLKEPDTSMEPWGMSALQVSAGREVKPWLKCRQINSPVLCCSKRGSETHL